MLQYFLTENRNSIFENGRLPQLLYLCNTKTMERNFPRVLHKHDDRLELVFIVKGRGEHLIGDIKYRTQAGDLLIFNCNVIHDEMAEVNSDMAVYCCGIKNLHIKGMEKNCLFNIHSPAVIATGDQWENIEKTLDIMFFHISQNTSRANEICQYLLASLLTTIIQLPSKNVYQIFHKKLTLIEQIKQYIDQHYWEDLTLNDLAIRFHISPYYLAHLFKQQTEFSPIQYMIRRRIGEAQSLLINTHYSIGQIASMVGYHNANYFSTLFAKMIGISPTAYRLSWIGK